MSAPSATGRPGKRLPPFAIRLNGEERARLLRQSGGMPLGTYVKAVLFGAETPIYRVRSKAPVKDQEALASVLACLGASRIANNLNQLAHAANTGTLYFNEGTKREIERASGDIRAMRLLLMRALGMSVDDQPKPRETVAQSFARATPKPKRFSL